MKTTTFLIAMMATLNLLSNPNIGSTFNLVCPEDVVLSCGADLSDLDVYGTAYYDNGHGTYPAGKPHVEYATTQCNTGFIVRTWTVEDAYWNQYSCSQTITISSGSFTGDKIEWPDSIVELTGCDPDTEPDYKDTILTYPTYEHMHCSHIGVNYKDQKFNFGPDCKKIIRTWTLIDWCIYHPQTNPGKGIWSYNQTIKISASEEPVFECLPEINVSSLNCESALVTLSDVVVSKSECGGIYTVEHDSPYADTTGYNASGVYPIGSTDITYSITYGCGRIKYCRQTINVFDDTKPVPYCLGSLTVALMGMDENNDGINDAGMVEIWAKDLDHGSYHPCGRDVHLSFSTDRDSMFRVFTCDDVGINLVRLYVSDHLGNYAYCIVEVVVQNNGANIENCEEQTFTQAPISFKSIEGKVNTGDAEGVDKTYVTLYSTTVDTQYIEDQSLRTYIYEETLIDSIYNTFGEVVYNQIIDSFPVAAYDTIIELKIYDGMTDDSGRFKLDSLNGKFDYKMVAHKISYDQKKINVFDAKAILDHISGRKKFDSPYQYIAADINFDKAINTKDVLALLDFIQGDTDVISLENRWKFVDPSFDFNHPSEILLSRVPNYLMYMKSEEEDKELIGICVGDVVDNSVVGHVQNENKMMIEMREAMINSEDSHSFAPNPFSDKTTLSVKMQSEKAVLMIWDISGKEVLRKELALNNGTTELIINELEQKGIYLYKIIGDSGSFQGKLISQ